MQNEEKLTRAKFEDYTAGKGWFKQKKKYADPETVISDFENRETVDYVYGVNSLFLTFDVGHLQPRFYIFLHNFAVRPWSWKTITKNEEATSRRYTDIWVSNFLYIRYFYNS